jgi:uncharacterized protein YggT (Ycf19 family)
MVLTFDKPLSTSIDLFFHILIIFMFVRVILSWIQLPAANPIVRFFGNVVDPIVNPIARRLPRMSAGAFDIGFTVAFIFMWWALSVIDGYILFSLPPSW